MDPKDDTQPPDAHGGNQRRTSEPSAVLSTAPDFADLALGELRRAAPKARARLITPGVYFLSGISFRDLSDAWRESAPIFVRHVAPIDMIQTLAAGADDIERLYGQIAEVLAPRMAQGGPFSVQTRVIDGSTPHKAFGLNVAVSKHVASVTGLSIEVRRPSQIISILIHQGRAHAGLSTPAENLSSWSGGQHHFAREPEQLSRAEFKLLEALDSFGLQLHPGGRVLDLGAAPGGWSRILRKHDQHVVAVDPARLHPSLDNDPRLEHHSVTAETYLASAQGPFDAILNDIREEPRDSAALMQSCAALLTPDGFALVTIKLRHAKREPILAATLERLAHSYGSCRARQLFHNRSEVTVLLREPRADEPPE